MSKNLLIDLITARAIKKVNFFNELIKKKKEKTEKQFYKLGNNFSISY